MYWRAVLQFLQSRRDRAIRDDINRRVIRAQQGHSLVELVVVLSLLGLCFAGGGLLLFRGLATTEARGSAQAWQAAGALAQASAIWQASATGLCYQSGRLAVTSESRSSDPGSVLYATPTVPAAANVVRWRQGEGIMVRFSATSGSPDSAGSLFFRAPGGDYRVTVRLESGLTVRTRVAAVP